MRAEDLVWIFGTGRSGSTWLASMLAEMEGHHLWNEPLVGRLFGGFYDEVFPRTAGRESFIMSEANREAWLEGIRILVLGVASRMYSDAAEGVLVVQEPNGSVGAPLLMEALPESRMVLLVRDPRDVVASALDGHRTGGHAHERAIRDPRRKEALTSNPPENRQGAFTKRQAERYLRNVGSAKRAYDAHGGRKVLVKYEELRSDTLGTVHRICSDLGLTVDGVELARAVEEHAWENIPEKRKGEGKFHRKGISGGWRDDLSPRQVETVEEITAPLLEEFYPG